MSQFTVILLLVIVCLVSLFIWNGFNFRSLKKGSQLTDNQLNDSKYWELKYKYEFLLAIVGLITATISFLGYNSLKSIETGVRGELNKKVDSVRLSFQATYDKVNSKLLATKDSAERLNERIKKTQNQLKKNAFAVTLLTQQQFSLKESAIQSKRALIDLSENITSINAKNKIKREFYLVTDVPFSGALELTNAIVKLKFADLKTSTGDKLPSFRKPPIVLSALENTSEFKILSIDNIGFEVNLLVYNVPIDDKVTKNTYYGSFIIYPTD